MAEVALDLTNIVVGLGNIGTGIGFDVAENDKMTELDTKSTKLKDDVTSVGNLYDQTYYTVAVNLQRFKKAIDKLPNDFLDKVEEQITANLNDSSAEEAIQTVADILGYGEQSVEVLSNLVEVLVYLRERKANGEEEPVEPTEDPFKNVPLDDKVPTVIPEGESSFPKTTKLDKLTNGLEIAGVVFAAAGLATTIGLGVWTLEKLNKAISDVEKKQAQVDTFQEALTNALDQIAVEKGKDYAALVSMAATWKKMSEGFDSYEKAMDYAIQGYFMKKSIEDIKTMVEMESDGMPFPEDCYALAKTLADDVNYQFEQKKTDKEVVAYFASEHPNINLRFVFDEYFISTLR